MDMKSRLSEWLDCAWFSYCCSDLEWLEKSIFPFESCAARHKIYGSLTLLSPYENSVYVKVERSEVLSDERLEGRVSLAARCRCSGRLARPAAASPRQPAREGWGERDSSCRSGAAKTDWALAIWREKNFIPNFRGRIRGVIASNLRKFNGGSYRLFSGCTWTVLLQCWETQSGFKQMKSVSASGCWDTACSIDTALDKSCFATRCNWCTVLENWASRPCVFGSVTHLQRSL